MKNIYTNLARTTIEKYLSKGIIIDPPKDLPKELKGKAGVFVSLHLENPRPDQESLRGCIGTFLPTKINIAKEIIDNAISAASKDYRFSPITKNELDNLEISVDILDKPKLITNKPINQLTNKLINQLDPKKYGVIVKSSDERTGLLLPDIEGVDSALYQIAICRQKAGIGPNEPINIYRFEVKRHKER